MGSSNLSHLQLQITMHLANGLTFDEIARMVDRSTSNVKQHANNARRRTGAKTLPQLVSIVIANGQLTWADDHRTTANGA